MVVSGTEIEIETAQDIHGTDLIASNRITLADANKKP